MNKAEIAERLEEIAVLLELKGENSFKTRAYQSGARLLDLMGDEEFRRHVEADDWRTVKGVGEALAAKIMELHGTGRLEFLEKLRASIPPGLVQMLEIPGLGPKKVKALNEQLGIETVAALEKACQEGLVAELSGFGFKTQDKILKGIANREAYSKRHLWLSVWYLALPILEQLRQLPQVRRAEAAGSLRRGMETVGDVDFIVASSEAAPVAAWFVSMPGVQEVTGQGETKCSVRLEGGLQADLRIVPEAQFAFALHHFTGSKQHNILMRHRGSAPCRIRILLLVETVKWWRAKAKWAWGRMGR